MIALGRRPIKAVVGELIPITANVFREGHDEVSATAVLTESTGALTSIHMQRTSGDQFIAWIAPTEIGDAVFHVEAWGDPITTWIHRAEIKIPANSDVELEMREGELLYAEALKALPRGKVREPVKAAVAALKDKTRPAAARLAAATAPEVRVLLHQFPLRENVTATQSFPIMVERERALYGSWYEFFPRSEGATVKPPKSGTFATAQKRLDEVAAMGFDVVYLPPIHPIGRAHRKGLNNSLVAGADDPGSPWAIGSADGGHDAIHPDLGTEADFIAFVEHATSLGLEIALDLALQCSPDHPWVTEHPEWFVHRADGTIAYAENPPKKYQDIYPLNFDNDADGLSREVLRVVRYWISHGVTVFRVDNPHTKPPDFWTWLIGEVKATDPDVLFLAEAFTRPARMYGLAKLGFTQSYSYFTWRTAKWELEEFGREIAEHADYARPNLFVNTPDILHESLQHGGPGMFAIRAVLAATMGTSWGVYCGYELFENTPVRPGSEEYLDAEKYELRPRDFAGALAEGRSLEPFLNRLNEIRRIHPALCQLRTIRFHHVDNDALLAYSKFDPVSGDTVLVVVTLNPFGAEQGTVSLDMGALAMAPYDRFWVRDEISGEEYQWGQSNYVRLEPAKAVAHILNMPVVPAEQRTNLLRRE